MRFLTIALILSAIVPVCSTGTCRFISPSPFLVFADDWLKAELQCTNPSESPDSVIFEWTYLYPAEKENYFWKTLSHKTGPPFEYLIPCKDLPDGGIYIRAIALSASRTDMLGTGHDRHGIPVMLDRRPESCSKSIIALFGPRSRGGSGITGHNNRLEFFCRWDNDSLYVHVQIEDAHLNAVSPQPLDYGNRKGYFKTLWRSDGIEICIDADGDRREWKDLRDFELIVDAEGRYQGNVWDRRKDVFDHWEKACRVSVRRSGTVNQNSDSDSGYIVEAAIPWKRLGIKPRAGDTLGFDIQLFDLDTEQGTVFRSFWSQSTLSNNDNPSEWGSLVLVRHPAVSPAVLAVIILIGAVIVFLIKRARPREAVQVLSPGIKRAKDYIEIHYGKNLSIESIAAEAGLSKAYFSTLFGKEIGISVNQYLFEFRVKKAAEFMVSSKESVSQIAYQVGFKDQSHFTKVFKKVFGKTPQEFRQSNV